MKKKKKTGGRASANYKTPKKVREYQKRYYSLHKEERAEYYRKNRDKLLSYQREYYQKNKRELRAYLKKYYKDNREKILDAQKRRAAIKSRVDVQKRQPTNGVTVQHLVLSPGPQGKWKLIQQEALRDLRKIPKGKNLILIEVAAQ